MKTGRVLLVTLVAVAAAVACLLTMTALASTQESMLKPAVQDQLAPVTFPGGDWP